jgi:hypothetical protein
VEAAGESKRPAPNRKAGRMPAGLCIDWRALPGLRGGELNRTNRLIVRVSRGFLAGVHNIGIECLGS